MAAARIAEGGHVLQLHPCSPQKGRLLETGKCLKKHDRSVNEWYIFWTSLLISQYAFTVLYEQWKAAEQDNPMWSQA